MTRRRTYDTIPQDMPWRTCRVTVELPVRGPLGEDDLRWKIENMLMRGGLTQYFADNSCHVGKLRVSCEGRVVAGLRSAARGRERE